jgi:hypothetical protein
VPGDVIIAIHAAMALGWSSGWTNSVDGNPTSCSGRQPSMSVMNSSTEVITPAELRVMRGVTALLVPEA